MSTSSHSGSDKRVYRLALYGIRAAGKTCILTALAMSRNAHPQRLSCTWIERIPGHPLPEGDPHAWSTSDPYHLGWHWLHEQRERLRQAELPPPNPNRDDALRFLFDFSSPARGTCRIELIDYSGELIVVNAGQLASRLREHMQECDGILLLAETPYPGRELAPQANDFESLKSAFSALIKEREQGPRIDWPIAILFNKWDRRGDLNPESFADAEQKLQQFLDETPEPPHKSLVHVVENVVGPDNLRILPVSAFGEHELRPDGTEAPKLNNGRLKSFALEDGFLWVVQRRDELDIEQFVWAAQSSSWWAFPQLLIGHTSNTSTANPKTRAEIASTWLRGVSVLRALLSGSMLRARLQQESPGRLRVQRALRQLGFKLLAQLACVILLFMGFELLIDSIGLRSVELTHQDPSASAEQLNLAEDWVRGYSESPGYRHILACRFLKGRSDTKQLLSEIQNQRDDALWKPVDSVKDILAKAKLAKQYLSEYPNGRHVATARKINAEAELEQKYRENKGNLERLENEAKELLAQVTPEIAKLKALQSQLDRALHPDAENNQAFETRMALRRKITQRIAESLEADDEAKNRENLSTLAILNERLRKANDLDDLQRLKTIIELGLPFPKAASPKTKDEFSLLKNKLAQRRSDFERQDKWLKFASRYDALIRENRVPEAAAHLGAWTDHDDAFKALQLNFQKRAIPILQKTTKEKIGNREWRGAREAIHTIKEDANVVAQLPPADQKALTSLERDIDKAEDRHLYDEILKNKPECDDEIQRYLVTAPLKPMKAAIEKYKDWRSRLNSDLTMDLSLVEIHWHDKYYLTRFTIVNDITVDLDKKETFTATVSSKPSTLSKMNVKTPLTRKLSDPVTVNIRIAAKYGYISATNTWKTYTGKWEGSVRELLRGVEIDLPIEGFKNVAILKLSGIPVEPVLPKWIERR